MSDEFVRITIKVRREFAEQLEEWSRLFGITEYTFRSVAMSLGARYLYRVMAPEAYLSEGLKSAVLEAVDSQTVTESDLISALQSLASE